MTNTNTALPGDNVHFFLMGDWRPYEGKVVSAQGEDLVVTCGDYTAHIRQRDILRVVDKTITNPEPLQLN